MVINYLNVGGLARLPAKTYSPLLIDPDAVLPNSIPGKLFQPVSWRFAKIVKRISAIKEIKFTLGNSLEIQRKLTNPPPRNDLKSPLIDVGFLLYNDLGRSDPKAHKAHPRKTVSSY